MAEPLRVGLIGCGNVVEYGHRPALIALRASGEVDLVAVADVTPARLEIARRWFSEHRPVLYNDYRDVLARDDVEAIVTTVPQQFRRQIVLDAFARGMHVLSEKPLATVPAVAHELVSAADSAGCVLGMVHNYHFLPEYSKLHELVTEGLVGDLRVLTMHYLGVIDKPGAAEYQGDWRHTLAAGGGILMDMIHAVYLAEWFYGSPAEQVMAFVDAPTYASRMPEVEDLALAQVAYPGGYAALHHGWGVGVGGVDLSGSDGYLRMRYRDGQTSGFNQASEIFGVRDWARSDYQANDLETHTDNIARSFTRLWSAFVSAVRRGTPLVANGRVGARALEVALAAYLSGVTGRVVELPLEEDHPVFLQGIAGLPHSEVWPQGRTARSGIFGLRGRD
ncbi:MAG: Gfo/Idh/MocA family oxidoreductase [Anaerolineaceae bacterium]|nr:Gfo/Idh/MocA family oxidoreductase [Anaerolineaceae bacterium]MDE0329611.1 Gfo/Idh/MocA family oxidoreductase [Anaerolineaceae bacterium]